MPDCHASRSTAPRKRHRRNTVFRSCSWRVRALVADTRDRRVGKDRTRPARRRQKRRRQDRPRPFRWRLLANMLPRLCGGRACVSVRFVCAMYICRRRGRFAYDAWRSGCPLVWRIASTEAAITRSKVVIATARRRPRLGTRKEGNGMVRHFGQATRLLDPCRGLSQNQKRRKSAPDGRSRMVSSGADLMMIENFR
jgi:hypothetical protein